MTQDIVLKNNLRLTLRTAVPDDAEQILAYMEQMASESENITFGPGEFELRVEEERAFLQQSSETPTSLYLLAEIAGEIAGVLSFSAGKRQRTRHAGEFGISVLRKYWNLGVGHQLLTYFIDWAQRTETIRKINLHVRTDNSPAIHLYEKHGFVREGLLTRDFYLHGQFTDAYIMGLQIDPDQ